MPPPPFEGTLDPFQWTIANVRSDLYPKQFISIIPYWPQTSIHIIPLVWWKLGKLSVEVFNQGKPWSKRGRNWPKTTLLKSQGQCILGVCWKVRTNECTFRGFLQASFLGVENRKVWQEVSSGSLSPHTWLLRKCSATGVHRPLPLMDKICQSVDLNFGAISNWNL